MGIFSPKVDSGPSPEEIAKKNAEEKRKQQQAVRESVAGAKTKLNRSDFKRNPGLFVPGGA